VASRERLSDRSKRLFFRRERGMEWIIVALSAFNITLVFMLAFDGQ
jgi:hypothetical protein